ncbi:MAG: hypothetical protein ACLRY5_06340 [Zhenhengia sp.]
MIVRGVPEEKVPLAIKSFQLYNNTVAEIKREVGQDMQEIYK